MTPNTAPHGSVKANKHSQYQSFLLAGLFLFFVGHFLLLNPSNLENDFSGIRVVEPQNLLAFLKNEPKRATPDVPTDEAPSYALKDSIVYATSQAKPSFRLDAARSNYYQKEQIIHGLDVKITYSDGTVTTADEAVYFSGKDEANLYGHVHTVFKNGATLDSNFAKAFTKPVTKIFIPLNEQATGMKADKKSVTHFTSMGLDYVDEEPKILKLLSHVHVWIQEQKLTNIYSDQATYEHEAGYLHFFMNESRPLSEQFVKTDQVDFNMKSRTLDAQLDEDRNLHEITAYGDVWTRDAHDPEKISTSTSGKAIYNQEKNDVTLLEFPQVYQDGDTITGDTIIYHRETDQIEVKQSNAVYNNSADKKSDKKAGKNSSSSGDDKIQDHGKH